MTKRKMQYYSHSFSAAVPSAVQSGWPLRTGCVAVGKPTDSPESLLVPNFPNRSPHPFPIYLSALDLKLQCVYSACTMEYSVYVERRSAPSRTRETRDANPPTG